MKKEIYNHKLSEETRKKLSLSHKGKHHSKETRKKMSLSRIGKYTGKNCPVWKGKGTKYEYPNGWNEELRDLIRLRDNYTCQDCGKKQDSLNGKIKKLDVHHIDYDKDNLNRDNLITLCRSCHKINHKIDNEIL